MNIRKKLILGIFFMTMITCGGMGLFSYKAMTGALTESISESLPDLAVEAGKYIRSQLDNHTLAIEGIANRHVIRRMDWAEQEPALINETKRLGYLGMGIVDLEGQAHYPGGKTADLHDRDYVQNALAGKTVVSDVIVSKVTHEPVMMVATPIYDDSDNKKIVSALIARLDAMMLSNMTKQIKYGENGYSYIINDKGALVAHNKAEYVTSARNFLEEGKTNPEFKLLSAMMQKMANGETGFDEYKFSGCQRMFGYAPLPGSNWSIAVGAVKDEVLADAYSIGLPMLYLFIGFVVVGILFAAFFANSISNPILLGVRHLSEVATNGDLSIHIDEKYIQRKDEIGQLALAVKKLVDSQNEQAALVTRMSEGNWNVTVPVRSDKDHFGKSLAGMVKNMNQTLQMVNDATVQVSTGASQIASASQSLSIGTTKSAASLEEISASITQIESQTKQNAENAQQANQLSSQSCEAAETGSKQMAEMVSAMDDINQSSNQIARIIKVIDDIAFQTNLLALNAAVEAARAGRHGKGFAVVAEEVRNLAARSAKAAKETADLIEASHTKVTRGANIAEDTSEALAKIVEGVTAAADLIGEIAAASSEQAQGISQISVGLEQIDSVTQQNSANAEETAAAAEELSGQARSLQEVLSHFHLNSANPLSGRSSGATYAAYALTNPSRSNPQHLANSDAQTKTLPYSAQIKMESEKAPIAPKGAGSSVQLPAQAKMTGVIDPNDEINLDDDEFGKY